MLLFYWNKALHVIRLVLTSDLEVRVMLGLRRPFRLHGLHRWLGKSTFNFSFLCWALALHWLHVSLTYSHSIGCQLWFLFIHLVIILGAWSRYGLHGSLHLSLSVMRWLLIRCRGSWSRWLSQLRFIIMTPIARLIGGSLILGFLWSYRLMLHNSTATATTSLTLALVPQIHLRIVETYGFLGILILRWLR